MGSNRGYRELWRCLHRYLIMTVCQPITAMLPNLLSRLPLPDSQLFIDVDIFEGTLLDAQAWNEHVQPHIATTARLDAAWNWPYLLQQSILMEAPFGRRASLQCINVPNNEGQSVPVAIMILSEGYPALDGSPYDSVFVWYLATAPQSALVAMAVSYKKPGLLLQALVDTAIYRSYELGYDGRVGLHAAPQGGSGLFCKYRDDVRMPCLQRRARLSLARRLKSGNDGRYFWTEPKIAQSLFNSLTYLR